VKVFAEIADCFVCFAGSYAGLDEEVAQALLDLAHYGERHREHLTRYARSRANRFVWVKASGWDS
jgi:hypothetical protein